MKYRISKTKYLSGMQCLKRLWLQYHKPDEEEEAGLSLQSVFDQGHEVGELAQKQVPKGLLISAKYNEIELALKQTEEGLKEKIIDLFEPCFIYNNILVRVDILHRNEDGTFDIIEVKSSTSAHDEHVWDIACQVYVLEGCGYRINKSLLRHINNECRYPDFSNFFADDDLTTEVRSHLLSIEKNLEMMFTTLEQEEEPIIEISSHCNSPYECLFQGYCYTQRGIPEVSIFNIPRLTAKKADLLFLKNIVRIEDIPLDYPLSDSQTQFVDLYRTKTNRIDKVEIKLELGRLTFPLHFLDFETDAPAIPWIDGLGPYQKFPFQYSLHILEQNGTLNHKEYLHTEKTDPKLSLAKSLVQDIGESGTIIAYNASFEKSVIKGLSNMKSELSLKLIELLPRFYDLLDIFRKYYFDPTFGGSNSIKSVLPVLWPDLSYKTLDVQDGTSAQITWRMMINCSDTLVKGKLIQQLKAYCGLDTLAMVRIHGYLLGL